MSAPVAQESQPMPPPPSPSSPSSPTTPSWPTPSSKPPPSPSTDSCTGTVLCICVCFTPAPAATAAAAQTDIIVAAQSPRYGDTQVVNMAFSHNFVPTPDIPLTLDVRRCRPVRSVCSIVDECLPQVTRYNLCNIHQVVYIDCVTNPSGAVVDSADPLFDPDTEPSFDPAHFDDPQPEPPRRSSKATTTPLLLGALAIILAAVILHSLIFLLPRPLPRREMEITSPPPPPSVCTTSYAVLDSLKQPLFNHDFPLTYLVYDAIRMTAMGAGSITCTFGTSRLSGI